MDTSTNVVNESQYDRDDAYEHTLAHIRMTLDALAVALQRIKTDVMEIERQIAARQTARAPRRC